MGIQPGLTRHRWLGWDDPHLDASSVTSHGGIVLGCYGGRRDAGATVNEDGALLWRDPDGQWELAVLLDAHDSADSAALVLSALADEQQSIVACLSGPLHDAFRTLQQHIVSLFCSETFRARCREVRGETACLVCARKGRFLWWLNVGDCALYLLHPELADLGQTALNQRNFYEWIGRHNTFDLPIPCHSSGVRELRRGLNVMCLVTDGLFQSEQFAAPEGLYARLGPHAIHNERELVSGVEAALSLVHERRGRDSATVIAWLHDNWEAAVELKQ